jgi:hypothetical protein
MGANRSGPANPPGFARADAPEGDANAGAASASTHAAVGRLTNPRKEAALDVALRTTISLKIALHMPLTRAIPYHHPRYAHIPHRERRR